MSQTKQWINFSFSIQGRGREAAVDKITDCCGIILRKELQGKQKHHLPFYHIHLSQREKPTASEAAAGCSARTAVTSCYKFIQVSICMLHLQTSTHSNKNLCAAVRHLDVLVVHEAAHDSDVRVALCGADPRSLGHLFPHTARPVFAPPRVMG